MGDQLLVSVAKRLNDCLRPGDSIVRFSGDEFTALLQDLPGIREAIRVTKRMISKMQGKPFDLNGQKVFVTASIGIAVNNSPREQPTSLLRKADLAMYKAKRSGKAHYAVFESSLEDPALRRRRIGEDLTQALEREEFRLYYQPRVSLDTSLQQHLRVLGRPGTVTPTVTRESRIVGMETLLRWNHPEYGMMLPEEFLSIAEEIGLIVSIDQWVLEESCRQVREWQDQGLLSVSPLLVSVNLSAGRFRNESLVQDVASVLGETGLKPSRLGIEITEGTTMHDAESATSVLRELKTLGVKLLIDDFGAGHSSLSNLKNFPVDYLKIDHSFVKGLKEDPGGTEVVVGIINLAHVLGIQVTAAGIETISQFSLLRALGADEDGDCRGGPTDQ
ncbi:MAG: bifunctional diguanylate cyclase/phosphodiesterase [Actinomycetota bacterium]|nr:bifunctional diguanylate cyclase/phosphodiesterase [Actinomycetota bacterium]